MGGLDVSRITYWECDVCNEKIPDGNSGIGIVFHSAKSGDFTLELCHRTDGRHICLPCARTLRTKLWATGIGEGDVQSK